MSRVDEKMSKKVDRRTGDLGTKKRRYARERDLKRRGWHVVESVR